MNVLCKTLLSYMYYMWGSTTSRTPTVGQHCKLGYRIDLGMRIYRTGTGRLPTVNTYMYMCLVVSVAS